MDAEDQEGDSDDRPDILDAGVDDEEESYPKIETGGEPRVWTDELELNVQNTVAADAVIPVRWCLKPTLMNRVADSKDLAAYRVLLTTVRNGREVGPRQIVPLSQLIHYYPFSGAGTNTIHALLLRAHSSTTYELNSLESNYLSGVSSEEYALRLFDMEGKRFPPGTKYPRDYGAGRDDEERMVASAQVTVEVDRRFFATEPKAWLGRWANLFFREPPFDECAFRKRKIFAFTLQPFVIVSGSLWYFLFFLVSRMVCAIPMFLLAYRDWNWSALKPRADFWKPGSWYPDDIVTEAKSFIFHDPWGNKWHNPKRMITITDKAGRPRRQYWAMFTPWFLLLSGGLVWMIYLWTSHLNIKTGLAGGDLVLSWSIAIASILALAWLISRLSRREDMASEKLKEWMERRQSARQERELAERQQLLSPLAATDNTRVVDHRAVPRINRTLGLMFSHWKSKVCRPFGK